MEDHAGIQGVVGLPRALYRKKKYSIFQSILAEHSSIFHGLSNGTCPGNKLPRVTEIWIIIIIIRCMKIFFSLLLPEGQNISGLSRPKSRREKHNSKKKFCPMHQESDNPYGPNGRDYQGGMRQNFFRIFPFVLIRYASYACISLFLNMSSTSKHIFASCLRLPFPVHPSKKLPSSKGRL